MKMVINRVVASEDELAHAALFRWMMEKHKADHILQVSSQVNNKFISIITYNDSR